MTDLITRARKEWLEVHKSLEDAPDGEAWHYTLPCPTAVVSALLEVLAIAIDADGCPDCGRDDWQEHLNTCKVAATYRTIDKALGGEMTTIKPLPCPVCGKEPVLWGGDKPSYRCTGSDKYTAHSFFAYGETPVDVLKRWNRMVKS